mgnify:CR=1 FL=1
MEHLSEYYPCYEIGVIENGQDKVEFEIIKLVIKNSINAVLLFNYSWLYTKNIVFNINWKRSDSMTTHEVEENVGNNKTDTYLLWKRGFHYTFRGIVIIIVII